MLYKKILKHTSGSTYPMHMPGHKRNPAFTPAQADGNALFPYNSDLTEIHGFDDLHNPSGVLLETNKLAAQVYKSRESFMLINGSTVGILAAVGAHTGRGDKILADTSCHRSVPNAAELFGLELVYIDPGQTDAGIPRSVTPEAVEEKLKQNKDIRLVVLTSPTYEGVVSDIKAIAAVTRRGGIPLLVDCAHGAHLGFSKAFPDSPVSLGADVVVMSLHKTLPAMTQCSLLHICSDTANTDAVKRMLGILQTSSPSYVLMASVDYCLRLLHHDADKLFKDYEENLLYFYEQINDLTNLQILSMQNRLFDGIIHPSQNHGDGFYDFDPGKIVITAKTNHGGGRSAPPPWHVLRDVYDIELERECLHYAIAMTSICDTREGFTRLARALVCMDSDL